jgi:type III pantothenate kinase
VSQLLIDFGNTRIKWALYNGSQSWQTEGFAFKHEIDRLQEQLLALPLPDAVYGCSVGHPLAAEWLEQFCKKQWGLNVSWLKPERTALGIHNLYRNLEQQGPDRWAAVLGARSLFPDAALVIASAGTALTVDALTEENEFLGGMILPGLRMMKSALADQTARLTFSHGSFHDFPRCTEDAIETGCLSAMAGSIMAMHGRLARRGEMPLCILAGGDAALIAPHLPVQPIIAEQLVLHGLAAMAQERNQ